MSYIVKNCPCIKHYDDIELDNRCMSNQYTPLFCENNPDCVIKQVIKIAKDIIEKDCYENSDVKAEKILQLFNIEEVRE